MGENTCFKPKNSDSRIAIFIYDTGMKKQLNSIIITVGKCRKLLFVLYE